MMLRRETGPFCIAVLLLALHVRPLSAQPDRDWVEVRSPNARVVTFRDTKAAREWAYALERARVVLAEVVGRETIDGLPPLTLIVTNRKRLPEWREKDERLTMRLWQSYRETVVLVEPSSFFEPADSAFRLLASYVVDRFGPKPPWLESGLRHFFASASYRGKNVVVGQMEFPCGAFFSGFRAETGSDRVPLQKVVASLPGDPIFTDDKTRTEAFGLSCALVHYVALGQKPEGLERILTYQEALHDGLESMAALEKALGQSAAEITKQLATYRASTSHVSYTFKSPPAIPLEQIPVRHLSPAAAATLFGTLLLYNGDIEPARRQLEMAAQLDPALPEPHARLGELHWREKNHELALNALDRALELDPNHAYALCERGRLRLQRGNPTDYDSIQADLERAIRLRPAYATAYSGLADLLEKDGGDPSTILALRSRAMRHFYRDDENALKLAESLLAAGKPGPARSVASGVLWSTYREESRKKAGNVIERARQLVASASTVKAARPAAEPQHESAAASAKQAEEPARPRLQRRENRPEGSSWVTGVIREAECQGFGLRLTLQSGSDTREFRTDNLLLVEFTDAVEPIPGNFGPCKKLAGRNARVAPVEGDDALVRSVSLLP